MHDTKSEASEDNLACRNLLDSSGDIKREILRWTVVRVARLPRDNAGEKAAYRGIFEKFHKSAASHRTVARPQGRFARSHGSRRRFRSSPGNWAWQGTGGWHSLPSEDWIVQPRTDWQRLSPTKDVAVGKSWELDARTTAKILIRCYPTTELNDLPENRIDQQPLQVTVLSLHDDVLTARLEGKMKMKHTFYPRRDDQKFVEAVFIGIMDFDSAWKHLRTFRLVSE